MSNWEFIVVIILRSPKVETVMKSSWEHLRNVFVWHWVAFEHIRLSQWHGDEQKNGWFWMGVAFVPHEITLCFFMDEGPIWILKAYGCDGIENVFTRFGYIGRLIRAERSESKCQKGMETKRSES